MNENVALAATKTVLQISDFKRLVEHKSESGALVKHLPLEREPKDDA